MIVLNSSPGSFLVSLTQAATKGLADQVRAEAPAEQVLIHLPLLIDGRPCRKPLPHQDLLYRREFLGPVNVRQGGIDDVASDAAARELTRNAIASAGLDAGGCTRVRRRDSTIVERA